jgi:hypothetical protein
VLVTAVLATVASVTLGVVLLAPVGATAPPAPQRTTVLLIGDSLLHQAARGVQAALPDETVVDESVPGSGFLNGTVNWSAHAARLVARYHPDIVVVSFIGNYDTSTGSLIVDTRPYYAAWDAAARRITDQLRTSGVSVDWVEQPPVSSPNFYGVATTRTAVLASQYRRLATQSGVGVIHDVSAISGTDGTFTRSVPACSRALELRIADGVHFTAAGGDWWGAHIGHSLATLNGLTARHACDVMSELDPRLT